MSIEERITKLENNYNMLTGEINKINTSLSNINTKFNAFDKFNERLDKLLNIVENKIVKQNNNNSLVQKSNPFCYDAQEYNNENSDSDNEDKNEISSNEMNNISQSQMDILQYQNNEKKRRKKYKEQKPLYYYYNVEGNIYRYICKNENRKTIMDFRCSNTNCPAKGYYYLKDEIFKPNVF